MTALRRSPSPRPPGKKEYGAAFRRNLLNVSITLGYKFRGMRTEHFCTLFDRNFLPAGIALHESLSEQAGDFHLWILCMDEAVEKQLRLLALPNVTLIPLPAVENPRLLSVKAGRSKGEYCWTLTPFLPSYIFGQFGSVSRVTYVDADLFFFQNPRLLIQELEDGQAQVLITEHAYDPRYDQTATAGRFCVQFITFVNSEPARKILQWWQDRCVEWCFARHEDGKFGDQKYLDQWPSLFGRDVSIVKNKNLTLAPWNAEYYLEKSPPGFLPAFFHFHGLRLISPERVRLFTGYHIGSRAREVYRRYVSALGRAKSRLRGIGQETPSFPERPGFVERLRIWIRAVRGLTATAILEAPKP